MDSEPRSLQSIYKALLEQHGSQNWWPADSRFEVMVGAVLTQNTAWKNVEKAIANLRKEGLLQPEALLSLPIVELAALLRPSGYFNVKAKRLRALCQWLIENGGIAALAERDTGELRDQLLGINGVGPETADDILLYALDRPVFVIDAYTRRVFSRLGIVGGDEHYEELRELFENELGDETEQFNEYHALIVRHAAKLCRVRPVCIECSLRTACDAAQLAA